MHLEQLVQQHVAPLAAIAAEQGAGAHQKPIAPISAQQAEEQATPPWAPGGGGAWRSLDSRRPQLEKQYASFLEAQQQAEAGGEAAEGAAAAPTAITATSTLTGVQAVTLMQSMPDLIAPPLSAEVALKFFKGAQGEAPLKEHAVDYEYHADFEEWLTCLWRCVRLRFNADKDNGKALEEWLLTKVFIPPEVLAKQEADAAKKAAAAKKGKGKK